MKAPDKIYLERSLSFPDKFHSHWYREDVVGNGEEYIRKDALLEWAKEHQEGERQGSYTWSCYQIFIDKLNSL